MAKPRKFTGKCLTCDKPLSDQRTANCSHGLQCPYLIEVVEVDMPVDTFDKLFRSPSTPISFADTEPAPISGIDTPPRS